MNQAPNSAKPQPPQSPALKAKEPEKIQLADRVPVAMMKFSDREPLELPGLAGRSAVAGTATGVVFDELGKRKCLSQCWVIFFIPALRCFQVVYYPPSDSPQAPIERMVPEHQVRAWERL